MDIFIKLWQKYAKQNPQAKAIHDLFIAEGETVVNDHIALRTVDDPRVNIDVLARPFCKLGYEAKGEYYFKKKKLVAKHYETGNPADPKVFISQLIQEAFSDDLRKVFEDCIGQLTDKQLQAEDLVTAGTLWQPVDYKTYCQLAEVSEYAAWFYAFGFCANHFTVSINNLQHFDSVESVNDFLQKHGYALNISGGAVKGLPCDCLQQSSTLAEKVNYIFADGEHSIPSCYYEFALRYPMEDGRLFQGFIEGSADKIFESTDRK